MTFVNRSLLFDLDGTLIDSRQDLVSSVQYVLALLGFTQKSDKEIVSRIGNGLRRLLQDTLNIDDPVILAQAKQEFESFYDLHCVDKTVPYPGVVPTLKELQGQFSMAVVTNKPVSFANKILESLGMNKYFSAVIGGDSTSETKPSPLPLYEALRLIGSSSTNSLMVGDGEQDIQAGHSAGLKTCLVSYGFGYHPSSTLLRPTYLIDDFISLKEILNVVNK